MASTSHELRRRFARQSSPRFGSPVYESMPGWTEPTKGVRTLSALPAAARRYIARLEEVSGVRAAIVSTGSERDDTIIRNEILQISDATLPA